MPSVLSELQGLDLILEKHRRGIYGLHHACVWGTLKRTGHPRRAARLIKQYVEELFAANKDEPSFADPQIIRSFSIWAKGIEELIADLWNLSEADYQTLIKMDDLELMRRGSKDYSILAKEMTPPFGKPAG